MKEGMFKGQALNRLLVNWHTYLLIVEIVVWKMKFIRFIKMVRKRHELRCQSLVFILHTYI